MNKKFKSGTTTVKDEPRSGQANLVISEKLAVILHRYEKRKLFFTSYSGW